MTAQCRFKQLKCCFGTTTHQDHSEASTGEKSGQWW